MISEQTSKNFNALMHKLNIEAYMFSGVAAAFRKAGHHGCAAFAAWESRERWKYADNVKHCIEKLGAVVSMPALPEVKTDYATTVEALTTMQKADTATLKFIDTAMKAAGDLKEHYSVKKMVWVYGKMLNDYNEVTGVLKKIQGAGDDKAAIFEINESLMEKYGNTD